MTSDSIITKNDITMAAMHLNDKVETLAVKVLCRGEIRRATLNGTGFAALLELCSNLFNLDAATLVLKYQDDDGDKITMSRDGELQDALRLSMKDTTVLRVFVDVKEPVPVPVPVPVPAPAATTPAPAAAAPSVPRSGMRACRFQEDCHWKPRSSPHHGFGFGGARGGGFPHRGHFMHGGHGRLGPYGFGGCPFPSANSNSTPSNPPSTDSTTTSSSGPSFYAPSMFNHGVFSDAASAPPSDVPEATGTSQPPLPHHHGFPHHGPHGHPRWREESMGPYAARWALKERKQAMKEHIRFMKENAASAEDREAIKEVKQHLKDECKAMWHDIKEEKKEWKHCDKSEKKCHKDQRDKCKERKEKDWKYVAKHVADVTIPDNSELPADTCVTKTWRLKNAGQKAWPEDSQLIFISHRGDNLNGPERVQVGQVEAGKDVDVSVTFITPSAPGRYVGYYRMASSGDGGKFGQRLWVSFVIPQLYPNTNSNDVRVPLRGSTDIAMD